jgi:bifunctional enzyme CysN/CysC
MNLPNGRRVLVADSPGHEQYTRNMAVAASNGDVSILMVDAARGVRPQTHRHLTISALMGVKTIIVAVNKMDLVNYDHATFEEIVGTVRATAARLDVPEVIAIPVSAFTGDNITAPSKLMPWYTGPTLLGALEEWGPPHSDSQCSSSRVPKAISAVTPEPLYLDPSDQETQWLLPIRAEKPKWIG